MSKRLNFTDYFEESLSLEDLRERINNPKYDGEEIHGNTVRWSCVSRMTQQERDAFVEAVERSPAIRAETIADLPKAVVFETTEALATISRYVDVSPLPEDAVERYPKALALICHTLRSDPDTEYMGATARQFAALAIQQMANGDSDGLAQSMFEIGQRCYIGMSKVNSVERYVKGGADKGAVLAKKNAKRREDRSREDAELLKAFTKERKTSENDMATYRKLAKRRCPNFTREGIETEAGTLKTRLHRYRKNLAEK